MPERIVQSSDDNAAGTAVGAASLIQTVVWAIVVLVLLGIGIYLLVHFGIL